MNNKEINNKFFQKLIERYLEGKTTADELKLLINYYESFQKENEWVEAIGSENIIKERILINILEVIRVEDSKRSNLISLFNRNMIKYFAAASVVLFIAFYFLFNNYNKQNPEANNKVVNTTIKIGTDKATLTREDGSNIALEKGEKYTANNFISNGKELIYSQTNNANKEIAYNYLTIPRGGQFFIKLSDGTEVWLNSESKLKYPVSFVKGLPRQVELIYGEAYFDVNPSANHNGSKFKVLTDFQVIEVLGTEFNVKAYSDENSIYTTLLEGSVALEGLGNKTLIEPNEQVVFDKGSNKFVVYSHFDVDSEVAWKRGLFSFKDKSLKDIMKILSRWYDINVVFNDKQLEDVRFKGVLSKNQNIEQILTLIKNTNFINAYEINKNTITLK